jgi:hypothetical protein
MVAYPEHSLTISAGRYFHPEHDMNLRTTEPRPVAHGCFYARTILIFVATIITDISSLAHLAIPFSVSS